MVVFPMAGPASKNIAGWSKNIAVVPVGWLFLVRSVAFTCLQRQDDDDFPG